MAIDNEVLDALAAQAYEHDQLKNRVGNIENAQLKLEVEISNIHTILAEQQLETRTQYSSLERHVTVLMPDMLNSIPPWLAQKYASRSPTDAPLWSAILISLAILFVGILLWVNHG